MNKKELFYTIFIHRQLTGKALWGCRFVWAIIRAVKSRRAKKQEGQKECRKRENIQHRYVTKWGNRSFYFWWIVRKFIDKNFCPILVQRKQRFAAKGFSALLRFRQQKNKRILPLTIPRYSGIKYKAIQTVVIQSVKYRIQFVLYLFERIIFEDKGESR